MNKVIKDLIEKATTKEAFYPAGCNGYPDYRYDLNKEKFAELIVKECISLMQNEMQGEEAISSEWVYDKIVKPVKNHFEMV
jgi:hypothetical protein